jgi:hypothetical protein
MVEILKKRIPREHHRKHGRQSSSTTLHNFLNMLSTILQPNYILASTSVRPESIGTRRNSLKGCNSFVHPTIFSSSI